jgi:hypothetical protein
MRYCIIAVLLCGCAGNGVTITKYKADDPRLKEMLKGATPITDPAEIERIHKLVGWRKK